MTVELDEGPGGGLRPGLIVMSTDMGLEWEARSVFAGRPAGMRLAHAGRHLSGADGGGRADFGESDDRIVGRIPEAAVLRALLEVGRAPGPEAIFASCTNMRSMGVIDAAEVALGKPVVSSNRAMFWHMLQLAGAGERAR